MLAAALKANRRASIFGAPTPAMGAVQSLVPLGVDGERGRLYLTTERYLDPSGARLDKRGVTPDVALAPAPPDTGCRETDAPLDDGAGQCARRSLAEDPALQRALAHLLGEAAVAVDPSAAKPEPRKP